uniref:Uncharacterized protein n=1 Tax=Lepeophtheirus salmonis TaxID=72036 RepID=A0A0K2VBQ8_LEPSM
MNSFVMYAYLYYFIMYVCIYYGKQQ